MYLLGKKKIWNSIASVFNLKKLKGKKGQQASNVKELFLKI